MNRFERRFVFGMLCGIMAQTSDSTAFGLVMAVIASCYLLAAVFTKDAP